MDDEIKAPCEGMNEEEKTAYIMQRALEIIMSSGDARTLAKQALDQALAGDFEAAAATMKSSEGKQYAAHNIQTEMIQGDICGGDEKMGYNVLFAHAQDTLMTIQTEVNMTRNMINIMKSYEERIAALEAKLQA